MNAQRFIPTPHLCHPVFSCCKSQKLQHIDSCFLTVFLNPLYTHAIVIIEKIHVFLLIKQTQCYICLLVWIKTQSFTSSNIIYIIASGDYILLITIFIFHFCPTRSAQVISDGRFKECRQQWHHGYHRNSNNNTRFPSSRHVTMLMFKSSTRG